MGVIQYPVQLAGTPGVYPNFKYMVSSDSLSTITTAGYMNSSNMDSATPLGNSDIIMALYSYSTSTQTGTFGIFTVNVSTANGSITLTQWNQSSEMGPLVITTAVTSATPGTVRSVTGKITETATTVTSGNLVGTRGEVDMVGASGGFFYGAQGKVIPTGTLSGSSWTACVFGQFDISGATINAGQTAPLWGDYGATSGTITSGTGMYGVAMTNTTAATLEAMDYRYGKATNWALLNGSSSTYISSGGGGTLSGTIQKIAISIDGTTYYIPCATVIS
jgi:hypothetical protein